jgi:hypothetical protein
MKIDTEVRKTFPSISCFMSVLLFTGKGHST